MNRESTILKITGQPLRSVSSPCSQSGGSGILCTRSIRYLINRNWFFVVAEGGMVCL